MGSKKRSGRKSKSVNGKQNTTESKISNRPSQSRGQAGVPGNVPNNEGTTETREEDCAAALEIDPVYVRDLRNVHENEYLNDFRNMCDYDQPSGKKLLADIQTVYNVSFYSRKGNRLGHSMTLAWDHNRLWGRFNVGNFQGIILVDPGPGKSFIQNQRKPNEYREDIYYDFEWRGTSKESPDTVFSGELADGQICFENNNIFGHFGSMSALDDSSGFFGTPSTLVSRPMRTCVREFIDAWNKLGPKQDPERVRLPPEPKLILPPLPKNFRGANSKPRWGPRQRKQFLKYVTGVYNVKSITIQSNYPSTPTKLLLRLHVDEKRKCIWGKFLFGVFEGFMVLQLSSDQVKPEKTIRFRWHGTEVETGVTMAGFGEVRFPGPASMRIEGYFHDMYGDVDFSGLRKPPNGRPDDGSGYDTYYFRRHWNDHANGDPQGKRQKRPIICEPRPLPKPRKIVHDPNAVVIPNPMDLNPRFPSTPAAPPPCFAATPPNKPPTPPTSPVKS